VWGDLQIGTFDQVVLHVSVASNDGGSIGSGSVDVGATVTPRSIVASAPQLWMRSDGTYLGPLATFTTDDGEASVSDFIAYVHDDPYQNFTIEVPVIQDAPGVFRVVGPAVDLSLGSWKLEIQSHRADGQREPLASLKISATLLPAPPVTVATT